MSRFYQTTAPEFIDYLSKPNLEYELALAQKENQNRIVKDQLLQDVPDIQFDYWDFDRDRANAVKQEVNSTLQNISQKMYENPDDYQKHLSELRDYKNKLSEEFTNGRIYKLQKNAAQYRNFMDNVNKLERPDDRRAYMQDLDRYMKENAEEGAFKDIFQFGEMYDQKNIGELYAGSDMFKGLTPDEIKEALDLSDGRYISVGTKSDGGLSTNKVFQNFNSWFKGEGMQDYFMDRQMRKGERWFDENGNLDTSEGSAYDSLMQGVASLAYTNSEETLDKKTDSIYINNINYERDDLRYYNRIYYDENSSPEERAYAQDKINKLTGVSLTTYNSKLGDDYFAEKSNASSPADKEKIDTITKDMIDGLTSFTNKDGVKREYSDTEKKHIKSILEDSKTKREFQEKLEEYYTEGIEKEIPKGSVRDVFLKGLGKAYPNLSGALQQMSKQFIAPSGLGYASDNIPVEKIPEWLPDGVKDFIHYGQKYEEAKDKASDVSGIFFGNESWNPLKPEFTNFFNKDEALFTKHKRPWNEGVVKKHFSLFNNADVSRALAWDMKKDDNYKQFLYRDLKTGKQITDLNPENIISVEGITDGSGQGYSSTLVRLLDGSHVVAIPGGYTTPMQSQIISTYLDVAPSNSPVAEGLRNYRLNNLKREFAKLANTREPEVSLPIDDFLSRKDTPYRGYRIKKILTSVMGEDGFYFIDQNGERVGFTDQNGQKVDIRMNSLNEVEEALKMIDNAE